MGTYQDIVRRQERFSHRNMNTGIIAEVEDSKNSYLVRTNQGFCFGIQKSFNKIPKVGQSVNLYLYQGMGIQGIDLDGEGIFFKSKEDLEIERQEELRKMEARSIERKKKFDAELADPNSDFNKRLARLPKVFKQRFRRFFRLGDDFWDYAWYELDACETALKIACACRSWQNIRKFKKMSHEEQYSLIPSIDTGLSQNQFGFALITARYYLHDSKKVIRIRGAMSPLAGSKPYIGR